jgi:hypothetical protein
MSTGAGGGNMRIKPLLLLAGSVAVGVTGLAVAHWPAKAAPEPYQLSEDTVETLSSHGIEVYRPAAQGELRASPVAYPAPP